jgi:hypothetical protein
VAEEICQTDSADKLFIQFQKRISWQFGVSYRQNRSQNVSASTFSSKILVNHASQLESATTEIRGEYEKMQGILSKGRQRCLTPVNFFCDASDLAPED